MKENNKNYKEEIRDGQNGKIPPKNESNSMTEEELSEEYQKLPLWQQVILVLLLLFGLITVIIGIDFIVDFFTELLKRIF